MSFGGSDLTISLEKVSAINETYADYYDYDYCMGTLDKPTPLTSLQGLEDYCDFDEPDNTYKVEAHINSLNGSMDEITISSYSLIRSKQLRLYLFVNSTYAASYVLGIFVISFYFSNFKLNFSFYFYYRLHIINATVVFLGRYVLVRLLYFDSHLEIG